jgi:hypothetical protein
MVGYMAASSVRLWDGVVPRMRYLLTCVFYAMRDGQARSLAARTALKDAA